MITASELRIGNLVGVSWNNIYSTVIEITIDDVKLKDGFATYNQLQPIPLTEEWLFKFGFEKIIYDSDETGYGTEYHLRVNDELFISYEDDFSCELYDSKIRMPNGIGIIPSWEQTKYVHGLQNIVFALTGEELTLNS